MLAETMILHFDNPQSLYWVCESGNDLTCLASVEFDMSPYHARRWIYGPRKRFFPVCDFSLLNRICPHIPEAQIPSGLEALSLPLEILNLFDLASIVLPSTY